MLGWCCWVQIKLPCGSLSHSVPKGSFQKMLVWGQSTLLGSLYAAPLISVSLGPRRQLPVDACLGTVHTAGFSLRCSIALCFTQSREAVSSRCMFADHTAGFTLRCSTAFCFTRSQEVASSRCMFADSPHCWVLFTLLHCSLFHSVPGGSFQ